MGTETIKYLQSIKLPTNDMVKLNNPLMGTETFYILT